MWPRSVNHVSAFKTPDGEAAFLGAYDATVKLWPVPHEETDVSSRFGTTHVLVAGPQGAPPLVLLHGYWATSTMWSANIGDFSKDHRVYAIDVMGQPGRSVPGEPIRDAADYVTWLTATLDALHLERVSLVGMSFGGWLALGYAVAVPERLQKLVLLSPGGFLPMVKQFSLRGMLMVFVPSRVTVKSFMRWLGFDDRGGAATARLLELMYLGAKHFRVPVETSHVMPTVFSDGELSSVRVPTLLLIGEHEVISDPVEAFARARRLMPALEGELIPRCRHDMCVSQSRIVNARVLEFLKQPRTGRPAGSIEPGNRARLLPRHRSGRPGQPSRCRQPAAKNGGGKSNLDSSPRREAPERESRDLGFAVTRVASRARAWAAMAASKSSMRPPRRAVRPRLNESALEMIGGSNDAQLVPAEDRVPSITRKEDVWSSCYRVGSSCVSWCTR